ncbi:MAG: hypothetical protein ACRDPQ_06420 [Nocardioidaceae bacterium]
MTPPGDGADDRSNLEKLDDLQAAHPFAYNLAVGLLVGSLLLVFGVDPLFVALYAVSYATVRWFLWQDGRMLRRQYEARAVRWKERQAERRRRRGG